MNLWDYLSDAWSILWSKRSLWFWGLLAALGGSGFNYIWHIGELQPATELPLGAQTLLQTALRPSDPKTVIVIGLILGAAMFMLGTLAQGALIDQVGNLQKHREVKISSGLRAGWQYFGPLLAIRFLLAVPLIVAGAVAAHSIWPALSRLFTEPTGERLFTFGQTGQLAGMGGVLFALGLLIAALDIGAERAVVLEGSSIGAALRRSAALLWHNLLDYLALGVILLGLALIVALSFAVLLSPIFFVATQTSLSHGINMVNALTFTTQALVPLTLIVFALALVVSTLVTVFTASVWTFAYQAWQYKSKPQTLAV